jgi:hypothetical protein
MGGVLTVEDWASRKAQIVPCEAAVADLPSDTVLLDGELPTTELAGHLLDQVKMAPGR